MLLGTNHIRNMCPLDGPATKLILSRLDLIPLAPLYAAGSRGFHSSRDSHVMEGIRSWKMGKAFVPMITCPLENENWTLGDGYYWLDETLQDAGYRHESDLSTNCQVWHARINPRHAFALATRYRSVFIVDAFIWRSFGELRYTEKFAFWLPYQIKDRDIAPAFRQLNAVSRTFSYDLYGVPGSLDSIPTMPAF